MSALRPLFSPTANRGHHTTSATGQEETCRTVAAMDFRLAFASRLYGSHQWQPDRAPLAERHAVLPPQRQEYAMEQLPHW
jgi:hypothetical protein